MVTNTTPNAYRKCIGRTDAGEEARGWRFEDRAGRTVVGVAQRTGTRAVEGRRTDACSAVGQRRPKVTTCRDRTETARECRFGTVAAHRGQRVADAVRRSAAICTSVALAPQIPELVGPQRHIVAVACQLSWRGSRIAVGWVGRQ